MDGRAGAGDEGDPHAGGRVYRWGADAGAARAAVVLCHGRGANAEAMGDLVEQIRHPEVAYLAPQAAGYTWYPNSFLAPLSDNEPHLSSALSWVGDLLADLAADGIGPERVLLLGFSQGACLATEYAARNARRYGGLAALSGGVIGPEGTHHAYGEDLAGTPVLLGCSDHDPHVPLDRIHYTESVLAGMGGAVDKRVYRDMGHAVNVDEIEAVDAMLTDLLA